MEWKEKFPRNNLFYETERGLLYCGDSQQILKFFPSDSIDLIFTSPPYNIGAPYDI